VNRASDELRNRTYEKWKDLFKHEAKQPVGW